MEERYIMRSNIYQWIVSSFSHPFGETLNYFDDIDRISKNTYRPYARGPKWGSSVPIVVNKDEYYFRKADDLYFKKNYDSNKSVVALLAFEAIILPHPPNLTWSAHYHSLQITFVIVLYLIIKMKLKYNSKHSNT